MLIRLIHLFIDKKVDNVTFGPHGIWNVFFIPFNLVQKNKASGARELDSHAYHNKLYERARARFTCIP